jgi:hypothetical protein
VANSPLEMTQAGGTPAIGGLHLPHSARAPVRPKTAELANPPCTNSRHLSGVLCEHGFSLHTADKRYPSTYLWSLADPYVPNFPIRSTYRLTIISCLLISRQLLPYHFPLIVVNDVLSTWYEINRFTAVIPEVQLIGDQLAPDLQ